MFLSLLDTTIVAAGLLTIGEDFGAVESINWIALAYTLSYLGCAVFFARIADIVGRRNAYITALVIFLAFSLGCGFAQTLEQLIALRVMQGIGGSGLYSLTFVILPEISPPEMSQIVGAAAGAVVASKCFDTLYKLFSFPRLLYGVSARLLGFHVGIWDHANFFIQCLVFLDPCLVVSLHITQLGDGFSGLSKASFYSNLFCVLNNFQRSNWNNPPNSFHNRLAKTSSNAPRPTSFMETARHNRCNPGNRSLRLCSIFLPTSRYHRIFLEQTTLPRP